MIKSLVTWINSVETGDGRTIVLSPMKFTISSANGKMTILNPGGVWKWSSSSYFSYPLYRPRVIGPLKASFNFNIKIKFYEILLLISPLCITIQHPRTSFLLLCTFELQSSNHWYSLWNIILLLIVNLNFIRDQLNHSLLIATRRPLHFHRCIVLSLLKPN